jgi:hypothetical protein
MKYPRGIGRVYRRVRNGILWMYESRDAVKTALLDVDEQAYVAT